MEIIWLLIWLFLSLFMYTGVSSTAEPVPMPSANTFQQPILIDSVDFEILESFPMQVILQVEGTIQDGCNFPVIAEQTRTDNTLTVNIYREMPLDVMCPMMIQSYSDSIPLGGDFVFETYTINVNDTAHTLNLGN